MPHFKNSSGQLYWLDPGDDPKQWLTEDCVLITDDEANSISAKYKPNKLTESEITISEIVKLESQHLLPRVTREFMLAHYENTALQENISPNKYPAYRKIKELDDNIKDLRKRI